MPERAGRGAGVTAPLLAGVEMGGTKCICILAAGPDDIREQVSIPTADPATTLATVEAVLDRWRGFAALGIASFGPLDLDPVSAAYGAIVGTPKPGWSGTDLWRRWTTRYGVPTGLDTDVGAAALAERRWGAARGLDDVAYITVGTGVGGGLIVGGRPVRGLGHAEIGHVRVRRLPGDDWPGCCPLHGDCVEGLASGTAIRARAGIDGTGLPADHPVWLPVADALAQLLHGLVMTLAPRIILMGGGVIAGQPQLLPMIRQSLRASLAGYPPWLTAGAGIDDYVAAPGLGPRAGPLGAIALAEVALEV